MDKCVCHINGYAIKDATARKEIENIKIDAEKVNTLEQNVKSNVARLEYFVSEVSKAQQEINVLRENVGNTKVAFLTQCPFISHSGATMFFCATTPYHDVEIIGGSFWYEYEHYNLMSPVKLVEGNSSYLYFENQSNSVIMLEIVAPICVKRNNAYYWSSQSISVFVNNNQQDVLSFFGQNCTMLLKSSEA